MPLLLNIYGEYMDSIMGMTVPTASTPGQQYANDITNALLYHVAPHTHSGANNLDGYQLDADGLALTQDIQFNNTNADALRSVRFQAQPSVLTGIQDINSIYDVSGDIWINDGNGNNIRVTENGALVPSSSSSFLNFIATSIVGAGAGAPVTIPTNATYNLLNVSTPTQVASIILPLIANQTSGRYYYFVDTGGNAGTNFITVYVATGSTDTFNSGGTSFLINNNGGYFAVYADPNTTPNTWVVFDQNVYNSEQVNFNLSTLSISRNATFVTDGTNQFLNDANTSFTGTLSGGAGSGSNVSFINNAVGFSNATVTMNSNNTLTLSSGSTIELQTGTHITVDAGGSANFYGTTFLGNGTGATLLNVTNNSAVNVQSGGLISLNSGATLSTLSGSSTINVNGSNTIAGTLILGPNSGDTIAIGNSASGGTTLSGTTTLPSSAVLIDNGAASFNLSCLVSGLAYLVHTFAQGSNFNVTNQIYIGINQTAPSTSSVTLPASPSNIGQVVIVGDCNGYGGGGSTVTVNGNGHNVNGSANQVLGLGSYQVYRFIYTGATFGWVSI